MKKFMIPFAAVAASFAAQHAAAVPAPQAQDAIKGNSGVESLALDKIASNVTTVKDKAGDAFAFTLKRVGAEGRLMAWHESHASHASHTSHYSSRY